MGLSFDETRSSASTPHLFRALAHALATTFLLYPLFTKEVVATAALSALLGATLAPRTLSRLGQKPALRIWVWLSLVFAFIASAFFLRYLLISGPLFQWVADPNTAFIAGDSIFMAAVAGGISFSLRKLSCEKPAWATLEIAIAVFSVANLFSAHRNGAINRPFEIADTWLAQGDDPSHAFLLIGGVGSVLLVLLLLSEKKPVRALFQFSVLAALLWLIYSTTEWIGIPNAPKAQNANGGGSQNDKKGNDGGNQPKPKNQRPEENFQFKSPSENPQNNQLPKAVIVFQDDYSPPLGIYYFRQGAASQYNGKKLVASAQKNFNPDILSFFPTQKTEINTPKPIELSRGRTITTVALLTEHSAPLAFERPMEFQPTQNPNPSRFLRTYRVTSASRPSEYWDMIESDAGNTLWNPETWKHFTAHPTNPEYKKLAQKILAELLPEEIKDFPFAQATAISQWLGKNGTYSLKYTHKDSTDPTAEFLFGKRVGYCVHFAHAAAFLMRSIGLPARIASGYMSEESVRQGGSALLLLAGDAHAWPELYLEDYGWVPVDVYPENSESDPPPAPDTDLQKLLGEMARGQTTHPPNPEPFVPKLKEWLKKNLVQLGKITALLVLLGLALLYFMKYWRILIPSIASTKSQPRVSYRAALDVLSEQNLTRKKGETREHFAARLSQHYPSFEKITHLHLKNTFGKITQDEQNQIKVHLKQLTAETKNNLKPIHRFLGRIKPWSWLLSK